MKAIVFSACVLLLAAGMASGAVNVTNSAVVPGIAVPNWQSGNTFYTNLSSCNAMTVGGQGANGTIVMIMTDSSGGNGCWMQNAVIGMNASSGNVTWRVPTYTVPYQVTLKNGNAYVNTRTVFLILNMATGAVVWNTSLPSGWYFSQAAGPGWTDNDCLVAFAQDGSDGYSNLYSAVHFGKNAAGTWEQMTMWYSNTSYYPTSFSCSSSPMTVTTLPNGTMLVVRACSSLMMVLNLNAPNQSNVFATYRSSGSNPYSANAGLPIVWDGYMMHYSGSSYIYAFNFSQAVTYQWQPIASVSLSGTPQMFGVGWANGMVTGYAVLTSYNVRWYPMGSTSATVDLQSDLSSGGSNSMYPIAQEANVFYVRDYYNNVYRYDFGATVYTWGSQALLVSSTSSSTMGIIVGGNLYFGEYNYLKSMGSSSSSSYANYVLRLDKMSGAYNGITVIPNVYNGNGEMFYFGYDQWNPTNVVAMKRTYTAGVWDNTVRGMTVFSISNAAVAAGSQATSGPGNVAGIFTFNGNAFFLTADALYCYGIDNQTMLWRQSIPSTASTSISTSAVNFGFTSRYVLIAGTYGHLFVFDQFNMTAPTTYSLSQSATTTGCSSFSSFPTGTQFLSDPQNDWVYFSGRSDTYCVQRINAAGTLEGHKGGTYYPTTNVAMSESYVYWGDYMGNCYWARKSQFTSSSAVNGGKATYELGSDTMQGALVAGNVILFNSAWKMAAFQGGTASLINQWHTNLPISMTSTTGNLPFYFVDKFYVSTNNGSLLQYDSGYLAVDITRANWAIGPSGFGVADLGVPTIAEWGLFVFANGNGIIGLTYDSFFKFQITTDLNGNSLSCANPVGNRLGVAYVQCSVLSQPMQIYAIDMLKGQIIGVGPAFPGTAYAVIPMNSNRAVFVTGGQFVTSYNISAAPYTQNDLPASLVHHESLLDIIKQNKIWIAGAVAGVLVLIIIIAVAVKLCGGGKKDTDYVAMQNPVNSNSGV